MKTLFSIALALLRYASTIKAAWPWLQKLWKKWKGARA